MVFLPVFRDSSGDCLHSCFLARAVASPLAAGYTLGALWRNPNTPMPNTPVMWWFFHSYSLIDPKSFLWDHIGRTWPRCPQNAELKEKSPQALMRAISPCSSQDKLLSIGRPRSFGLFDYLGYINISVQSLKNGKTLWWKTGRFITAVLQKYLCSDLKHISLSQINSKINK